MIVAAHQPHYLPWLGYLDKLAKADLFVVMDDLQYEAQNYQNRQRVKLATGAAWLTVPLARGAQDDRILDKRVEDGGDTRHAWRHRHWRTLETSYGRAPHFARYADELRAVYARSWTSLVELDLHMLDLARRWLAIKTPILRSSTMGLTGAKTDRLIDLCRKTNARCYLTGSGGSQDYLDVEQMGRAGIGVIWQHFEHPVYPQRYGERGFVRYLGFLDLVLNCGPDAHDVLFARSHPLHAEAG
jgi:WbqC-like protein family